MRKFSGLRPVSGSPLLVPMLRLTATFDGVWLVAASIFTCRFPLWAVVAQPASALAAKIETNDHARRSMSRMLAQPEFKLASRNRANDGFFAARRRGSQSC